MATLLFKMTFLVVIHLSKSCGNPVDVKAALVNNGRSIEFTWRPPNTGSVEDYIIDINGQDNRTTDTKYLIQNPEKRLYTFIVKSYCGTSGYSPNWVRATIGFVGLAVYATIGQSSVSIRWRTTATIHDIVDVKNKDISTSIFFLQRSNTPILLTENQYKGRITYTGDLANGMISFKLSNVTSRDAGYYTCRVGTTDMSGQVLVVLDKPRKPTINNIFSYVSKPLELSCNSLKTSKPYYNTPELNYTWLIDGSVHVYNTRHQGRYRQNQDKLVIDNVTKEDKGRTFSCEASDRGQQSEQSNTIKLDPRFGPEKVFLAMGSVLGATKNVAKVGDQFGPIECIAACNPSCTFTWEFRKTGNGGPRTELINSNVLTVSQVTRESDGEYRCVAKSPDSHVLTPSATKTIYLNVQFQPEIKNITQVVNGGPIRVITSVVTVSENDDVNLQCNTEANPKARVSWSRDEKILKDIVAGESPVYNLGPSISCETSGIYSCVADNRIPPAANRTVNLLVQCKPKQDLHSPVHTRYSSLLNSTVNVNLSVLAYPRPEHKWTSNTTGVVKERPIVLINSYSYKYEGTVTIRRTTDFGEYCLQLTNVKGSSQLCLQIQEGDVPMAPSTFGVENVSPEIITLTWISEFNGGIQQTFYLEYKELENGAGFTKINVSDSGLGETIRVSMKELKAGVYYTFRLYSRNALGDSKVQVIKIRTGDYPETSSSTGLYVGVSCVILVIVGIVVFVVLRRRKGYVENPPSGVNNDGENAKPQSKAKNSPGRVNTGLVSRERAVPPNILNLDTTQNPDDMYSEIADASMAENVKTSDRQTSGTEHDNIMDADGYLTPTEIEHEENSPESRKPYEKLLQEEPLPDDHGYMVVQYPGKGVVDSTNV